MRSANADSSRSASVVIEPTVIGVPRSLGSLRTGSASRRALLLDEPRVAVRILEGEEAVVALPLRVETGLLTPVREVERLADVDAALDELGPRRFDVRDAEMEAVQRARRHLLALQKRDRAGGARRAELHDPEVVAGAVVDVDAEADLVGIERFGSIHVGDGDDDELQAPVHGGGPPFAIGRLPIVCP